MPSVYAAVDRQLTSIQIYPAFNVASCCVAAVEVVLACASRACLMSAQAAITELSTIRPKENRAMDETEPPNHNTSPYAIRMMVKFLKIV